MNKINLKIIIKVLYRQKNKVKETLYYNINQKSRTENTVPSVCMYADTFYK